MKLNIYVHDFHLEIGHTRATIDLLNHLTVEQKSVIREIIVHSYTATDPNILLHFPPTTKIIFKKVPLNGLYPFIFKSLFYQLWTGFSSLLQKKKNEVSLSIGIAFLFPDIVNIQFIHHHWNELNRLYVNSVWYKRLYKKILFSYFNLAESIIYKKPKTNFLVLSKFTKDYLQHKFKIPEARAMLTYSNVNSQDFFLIEKEKIEILKEIGDEACDLSALDFSKPVYLFVGAFERKGLNHAIEFLQKVPGAQFIVIGKSESGASTLLKSKSIKIYHVPFTKKLNSYYNLADYFLFPTIYEPFGLVILEAAMTGLKLLIPRNNVGASELLLTDIDTIFLDQKSPGSGENKVLSISERRISIANRKAQLVQYSWDKSADIFFKNCLTKYMPSSRG